MYSWDECIDIWQKYYLICPQKTIADKAVYGYI